MDEDERDLIAELQKLLITAMVKLHVFALHSGTTFEEAAGKATGVELSPDYGQWGAQWKDAYEKRVIDA